MATLAGVVRNGGDTGWTVTFDVRDTENPAGEVQTLLLAVQRAAALQIGVESLASDGARQKQAIDAAVAARITVPQKV